MLACEIRRMQWKTWTHFLLSFLFDKDVYKLLFFFYNLSPDSKGGLNYFYLFSPYRERVGFLTLIYSSRRMPIVLGTFTCSSENMIDP